MALNITKLGRLETQVGLVKGKKLRFLGQVGPCLKDNCPIKDLCQYAAKNSADSRCTYAYVFLSSLYREWVDVEYGIGDVLNQMELDRIGVHLMPLYYQLIRFHMDTFNLERTTYENKAGGKFEYPQFKSIREVLHQLRIELKELNLEKKWEKKFGNDKALPSPSLDLLNPDNMQRGRVGAYEDMVAKAKAGKKK